MTWVALAVAGGLGAVCRHLADQLVRRVVRAPVPVGTLIVNVVGSFLLGLLTGWWAGDASMGDLRLIVGTGFLGGFTTFSTAAVEVVDLGREGRGGAGLLLGAAQLAVGLVAAFSGLALGRLLAG